MKATLTDLARRTAEVLRPVIHSQQTVEITEHGKVRARIVPARTATRQERKAAWDALKAIGPVEVPRRK